MIAYMPSSSARNSESPGELSGQVLRLRTIGPFTISETSYPAGLVLAQHVHRESHITFIIEGTFRERYATGSLVCRAGAVRFLPDAAVHETRNRITAPMPAHHQRAEDAGPTGRKVPMVPQKPMQIHGFSATWLANRLYAEFSRGDNASNRD